MKNSMFHAICNFVDGEISCGYKISERKKHICGNHFLTEEGLRARMQCEHLRVGSTFYPEVSYEDIENLFFDVPDHESMEDVALVASETGRGETEFVFEWEDAGYSLTFVPPRRRGEHGHYLQEVCNHVAVVVRWETSGRAICEAAIKTVYPVNDVVRKNLKYRGL